MNITALQFPSNMLVFFFFKAIEKYIQQRKA